MNVAVATRARIGFAIALASILGVLEAELCDNIESLRSHTFAIGTAIGCTGLALFLLGSLLERNSEKTDHPFAFLVSTRYWGMIWLLSTIGLASFHALLHPKVAEAKAEVPVPPPAIARTNPVVEFPQLEIQGLTLNGDRSSVLINGQVLFVGDSIGKAVVVAIDGRGATVAMEGQTNVVKWMR
jgi:hypothetical protein